MNMVIRPPRASYNGVAAGTVSTVGAYERREIHLKNTKGENLVCVWFTKPDSEKRPCVIYMHGNASNKMEGESYSANITGAGLDLFSLDFSGCGNSEGEYVTLGHKETDDLLTVIKYLV